METPALNPDQQIIKERATVPCTTIPLQIGRLCVDDRLRTKYGGDTHLARIGDALITNITHHPDLGTLYTIETFVWKNNFQMTINEVKQFFCEAARSQPT